MNLTGWACARRGCPCLTDDQKFKPQYRCNVKKSFLIIFFQILLVVIILKTWSPVWFDCNQFQIVTVFLI